MEIDGSKLTAIPETIDVAYKNPEKINRWNDIPSSYTDIWTKIFDERSDKISLDEGCPICNKKALHQYYSVFKDEKVKYKKRLYKGQGSRWQWCSSCFHYKFYHWAYIPLKWSCPVEIEVWKLMPVPEPINEAFIQAKMRSQ